MSRLPKLFISHGSPTFAIEPGQAGPALTALGQTLPRPKAILVVSPHWTTREPRVATTPRPQADVPVFQVSLPARLDGDRTYACGQALAPLAEEGVLVIGSGRLTHNLYEVRFDAPDALAA